MTPDWLEAVRNAWTSAEEVDFDEVSCAPSNLFCPSLDHRLSYVARGTVSSLAARRRSIHFDAFRERCADLSSFLLRRASARAE